MRRATKHATAGLLNATPMKRADGIAITKGTSTGLELAMTAAGPTPPRLAAGEAVG